jgi:DnaK suppressor protein
MKRKESQILNYDPTKENYDPLQDPIYMSPEMIEYFKEKLLAMREDLRQKEHNTSLSLMAASVREPDLIDQGVTEELRYHQFALQEHEHQLLIQIDQALNRLCNGDYGYCEETGEPIGIKRLQATPLTRYCLEIQQDKEQRRHSHIR